MTGSNDGNTITSLRIVAETMNSAPAADEIRTTGSTHGEVVAYHNTAKTQYSLPGGCPVTPLGKAQGTCFYLDALGQLMALKAKDHSRLGLEDLFGARNFLLDQYWPRYGKDGKPNGADYGVAAKALMAACAQQGVWSPLDKVRGRGAWRHDDGSLLLHCGNVILTNDDEISPGKIGAYVYPAGEPLPMPAEAGSGVGQGSAGDWLLNLTRTWNWKRREIDPLLLVGWIGAAIVGGALDWRPALWITGGQGTGKSTLHRILAGIFGGGLLSVSDTTAAGVWQKLGHAALPVAVDELEADTDNRKQEGIIKLARQAASGGVVLRGGQDHSGAEFIARSCFLFSSILIPPLAPQDLSRLAVLELKPFAKGSLIRFDAEQLIQIGNALRRRMYAGWKDLPERLDLYRQALIEKGHDARGADQFGTLLACADLLLSDGTPDIEAVHTVAELLEARALADWNDSLSDEQAMLETLLTSVIDPFRNGTRHTVAEWVHKAAGICATSDEVESNRILATYGLKVHEDIGERWLAIANNHTELAGLFRGTKWTGGNGRGLWRQSAQRLEGARNSEHPIRIGGVTARAVLIPLELVVEKTVQARNEDRSFELREGD